MVGSRETGVGKANANGRNFKRQVTTDSDKGGVIFSRTSHNLSSTSTDLFSSISAIRQQEEHVECINTSDYQSLAPQDMLVVDLATSKLAAKYINSTCSYE